MSITAAEAFASIASLDVDAICELGGVSKLVQFCTSMDIKKHDIDIALDDADDNKKALAKLLENAAEKFKKAEDEMADEIAKEKTRIEDECASKSVSYVKQRVLDDGVNVEKVDACLDGSDIKGDLLKLLVSPEVLKKKLIQKQEAKRIEEKEMDE